jgi:PHD/YefM family antitoxin component YafN of YafNO toxin-antitoxin module
MADPNLSSLIWSVGSQNCSVSRRTSQKPHQQSGRCHEVRRRHRGQEPIVIRRQDRDIAVVMSMADYERLRSGNGRAFLELRDAVAAEAAKAGLTDDRLAELLSDDAPRAHRR